MLLEAIKENKPDVVLVDMVMVGLDALAVMDIIRKDRMAKQYNTTATGVERSIRHAIDLSWQRGELAMLESYFGSKVYQAIVNKVVA